MTNAYILNKRPIAYGQALSLLTDMLAGAGWTYQGSGSGTVTAGVFANAPLPTSTVTISNASPGIVSWTTHGLQINNGVIFTTTGALPAPLVAGTTYYIVFTSFTANQFSVAATPGGPVINTTSAGSGTHTATAAGKVLTQTPHMTTAIVTITNASPAVVSWASHGLVVGSPVVFTTTVTLPTGLTPNTTYYVSLVVTTGSFQVSATLGGASLNTSGAGSGSHTGVYPSPTTWSTANAWARMQDPSGTREFLFQHDEAGGVKIRYSPASKFTGVLNGALTAAIAPTATDERYLRGSTAAFGAAWFLAGTVTSSYGGPLTGYTTVTCDPIANGSVVYQGAALSASPYGFWFASQGQDGSKTRGAGLMLDPVSSAPEDTDPYVIHIGSANSFSGNAAGPGAIGRDGGVVATWNTSNGITNEGTYGHMSLPVSSTVTISVASPAVVTWTAHGLSVNSIVILTVSGGSITTGFTAGLVYYVISAGLTANTFQLSATLGGTAVNSSGAATGTITAFAQSFFYVQPAGYSLSPSGSTTGYVTNGLDPRLLSKTNQLGSMPLNVFNGKYEGLPMPYIRQMPAIPAVTIPVASPAVVNSTGHGLSPNSVVVFTISAGGTMTTGLTTGTNYYVLDSGFTANSFQVATSIGGTAVNATVGATGTITGNGLSIPGLKGWSTLARWTTSYRLSFLDTLDNRNWICIGALWLPWDGTTAPIG